MRARPGRRRLPLARCDGVEQLRAFSAGGRRLLASPISAGGRRLLASPISPGAGLWTPAPHPWLTNDPGTVYGGVTTLLAQSAAAAAVQSTAPAGTAFRALDIKVNILRPIRVDGVEMVATGTLLRRGRRLAVATAEAVHGAERVAVATGTTALTPPLRR